MFNDIIVFFILHVYEFEMHMIYCIKICIWTCKISGKRRTSKDNVNMGYYRQLINVLVKIANNIFINYGELSGVFYV